MGWGTKAWRGTSSWASSLILLSSASWSAVHLKWTLSLRSSLSLEVFLLRKGIHLLIMLMVLMSLCSFFLVVGVGKAMSSSMVEMLGYSWLVMSGSTYSLWMGLLCVLRKCLLVCGKASEYEGGVGCRLARVKSPQWMRVFHPTISSLMGVP